MDIGGEYFEGDVRDMVSDMCAIVQNYFELGEEKREESKKFAQREKERRRQLEKKDKSRRLRLWKWSKDTK
jgi:hypothetical protein